MQAWINNKHISITQIAPAAMNYGQHQRYNADHKRTYQLEIPLEEFVEKNQNWFEAYQTDSIQDAEIDKAEGLELQIKYADSGFPSLKEMLKHNLQLLKEITLFFDYDVLENLFTETSFNIEEDSFLINSVDEVEIGDKFMLKGIAYIKHRPKN